LLAGATRQLRQSSLSRGPHHRQLANGVGEQGISARVIGRKSRRLAPETKGMRMLPARSNRVITATLVPSHAYQLVLDYSNACLRRKLKGENLSAAMSESHPALGNLARASRPSGRLTADLGRAPPRASRRPAENLRSAAVSVSEWTASARALRTCSRIKAGVFPGWEQETGCRGQGGTATRPTAKHH